jgi:hypothetical protein
MFWKEHILLYFILNDKTAYSLQTEDPAQKSAMLSLDADHCVVAFYMHSVHDLELASHAEIYAVM